MLNLILFYVICLATVLPATAESPLPCPQTQPSTGDQCTTPGVVCTYGNQTCCNGAKFPTFHAACVDDVWRVAIDESCVFGCEQQCPVEKPVGGAACKVQKELQCSYDLVCCNGVVEMKNWFSATCVGGKWQVVEMESFAGTQECTSGCATTCPTNTPLLGTPCKVDTGLSCSYDLPCCNGDKISSFYTARCVAGKWAVASLRISTDQCRNGCTSTCPSSTPLGGDSCQVLTSVSCGYNLPCCNGDKITNFYTARCVGGKWVVASQGQKVFDQCRRCTTTCPATKPSEGISCQLQQGIMCSYDLPCCNGGSVKDFYVMHCVAGKWQSAATAQPLTTCVPCPEKEQTSLLEVEPVSVRANKPDKPEIGCPSKAPQSNSYCDSEDTTCSYNPYCCCGDYTKCTDTLSATCEKGAWKIMMAAVDCPPCVSKLVASKYPPKPKDP